MYTMKSHEVDSSCIRLQYFACLAIDSNSC